MSANQPAKLGSRLLAIAYDVLIVFLITVAVSLITQQLIIHSGLIELEQVPISETESVFVIPADSIFNLILKSLWLILSFIYFGYFWTKRGQTPGMKVWKVKVINQNGELINWFQSLNRYITALFGIGLLFVIFNRDRLTLQDKLSDTSLVMVN